LLYWRAQCQAHVAPFEAVERFGRAVVRFREAGDAVGGLLAWAGGPPLIQAAGRDLRAQDAWVRLGEERIAALPGFPSPDVELPVVGAMFIALAFRRPDHPKLGALRERVLALASTGRPVRLQIAMVSTAIIVHDVFHRGELVEAEHALAVLLPSEDDTAPPFVRMASAWGRSAVCFLKGDFEGSRRAAEAGLRLVEETGIRVMECHLRGMVAHSYFVAEDPGPAGPALAAMEASVPPHALLDRSLTDLFTGWFEHIRGNAAAARRCQDRAFRIQRTVGMVLHEPMYQIIEAIARHALGEREEARERLRQGRAVAEEQGAQFYRFMGSFVAADLALEEGREDEALAPLRQALALAREKSYVLILWWHRARAARLLALALEHGIEPEYALQLIRLHRLPPPPGAAAPEGWPFPLRIRTLGRFEV
ncbi:MAG: hypothetical protein L0027_04955, partial [Candidatus Rokubacteria bacterium]|nr:hypothetical protein [Candidatus Rokubacteria bacterium]